MKKLVLMRHAKSAQAELGQSDFERPLNDRGKNDGETMGKRLQDRSLSPDLIICSAAKRTHKTAKLIAEKLHYEVHNIISETELYEASIADVVQIIRNLSDEYKTVVLVGHNPTITGLVGYLSTTQIEHMPTSAQVGIEFPFKTWKQVLPQSGELLWFDYPKNLFD